MDSFQLFTWTYTNGSADYRRKSISARKELGRSPDPFHCLEHRLMWIHSCCAIMRSGFVGFSEYFFGLAIELLLISFIHGDHFILST